MMMERSELKLESGARLTGDLPGAQRAQRMFSGLKIRKKLIVLHTVFSLSFGLLLLIAMSPAMGRMVDADEQDLAELVFRSNLLSPSEAQNGKLPIKIRFGDAGEFQISEGEASRLQSEAGGVIPLAGDVFGAGVVGFDRQHGSFVEIRYKSDRARHLVRLIYGVVFAILLTGYLLVAVVWEVFVLPQHVYRPIRAILIADDAVRSKNKAKELIPEELIPADELGQIMNSRNETVRKLRSHEQELAGTLIRLEAIAIDLHTKNRLLETARKNLEGADRLATLGMMSAGIAHELNTPLAVVKGLVGRLESGEELSQTEAQLLGRVVGRIEKLSDGLLDFARVRPPTLHRTPMRGIIDEAWTLVNLDRQSMLPGQQVEFVNSVDDDFELDCDGGRMVQVFVNLIRNAVHALHSLRDCVGYIEVSVVTESREDGVWAVISVTDNGGGIDPAMIDTLFEPFVSSRLDSQGTGLGLAVADGIVREHGGVVVPSNLGVGGSDEGNRGGGAKFDVHLPVANTK